MYRFFKSYYQNQTIFVKTNWYFYFYDIQMLGLIMPRLTSIAWSFNPANDTHIKTGRRVEYTIRSKLCINQKTILRFNKCTTTNWRSRTVARKSNTQLFNTTASNHISYGVTQLSLQRWRTRTATHNLSVRRTLWNRNEGLRISKFAQLNTRLEHADFGTKDEKM